MGRNLTIRALCYDTPTPTCRFALCLADARADTHTRTHIHIQRLIPTGIHFENSPRHLWCPAGPLFQSPPPLCVESALNQRTGTTATPHEERDSAKLHDMYTVKLKQLSNWSSSLSSSYLRCIHCISTDIMDLNDFPLCLTLPVLSSRQQVDTPDSSVPLCVVQPIMKSKWLN